MDDYCGPIVIAGGAECSDLAAEGVISQRRQPSAASNITLQLSAQSSSRQHLSAAFSAYRHLSALPLCLSNFNGPCNWEPPSVYESGQLFLIGMVASLFVTRSCR